MLVRLKNLPLGLEGVRAEGRVTKDDYGAILAPILRCAQRDQRRLRLLFHIGPECVGFTPGALWEDARLALHYGRSVGRIAVVTDFGWIGAATRGIAGLLPCPIAAFSNGDWSAALDWLGAPSPARVSCRMVSDSGVLVVEPASPLRPEDFDAVGCVAAPWIASHGGLSGVVVHMHGFPGYKNVGGFVRHVQFVRDNRSRVHRVAVATDRSVGPIARRVAERCTGVAVRGFRYHELDRAIAWASA